MRRIRDGVAGTVLVHTTGGPVFLRPGDEIPKGVSIDPSVVVGSSLGGQVGVDFDDHEDEERAPARNSSTGVWREFLTSQGVEFPGGAKRDELIDIWEQHK